MKHLASFCRLCLKYKDIGVSGFLFHSFGTYRTNNSNHENRGPILHYLSLLHKHGKSRHTKEIHAQIIVKGFSDDLYITSQILQASVDVDYSSQIFDQLKNPQVFFWNIMIQIYAVSDYQLLAISFYQKMLFQECKPNNFTFPSLISVCTTLAASIEGSQLHGHVIKLGSDSDQFIQSSLIHMYSNFGDMASARILFNHIRESHVVIWTTMVSSYSKLGDLESARQIFDEIPERDVVAWSSMISGYIKNKRYADGLALFNQMINSGMESNESALVSVASACAHLGALKEGRQIHLYAERMYRGEFSVNVGTALVDMYAKCGSLTCSLKIFEKTPCKNLLTWNAMMGAFAMTGNGRGALSLLCRMLTAGFIPDEVTFLGLLSAFSHGGMVEQGRIYFEAISKIFFMEPSLGHYACMVDLLARAGFLEEAKEMIQSMPVNPDTCIWGTLLSGCRMHGDLDLGVSVGQRLIDSNAKRAGYYVLLSNIYATGSRWGKAFQIRELMQADGVKSRPGGSLVHADSMIDLPMEAQKISREQERKSLYHKCGRE